MKYSYELGRAAQRATTACSQFFSFQFLPISCSGAEGVGGQLGDEVRLWLNRGRMAGIKIKINPGFESLLLQPPSFLPGVK